MPSMEPAAGEAQRRWRGPRKAGTDQTVPRTVPTAAPSLVTIERDTRFELATFSLGTRPRRFFSVAIQSICGLNRPVASQGDAC